MFDLLAHYQSCLTEAEALPQSVREQIACDFDLPDAGPTSLALHRINVIVQQYDTVRLKGPRRPAGRAWEATRYQVLHRAGGRCELCGASVKDGARLAVDHIKPISRFPELAQDPDNLQALCQPCNSSKRDHGVFND